MPELNEIIVKNPKYWMVLPCFAARAYLCRIFSITLRAAKRSTNS
jgi:hypothetical protein